MFICEPSALVLCFCCYLARSLSWKDLDLVVEWQPKPPYQHHMLDGVWPLIIGLILGVVGALFLGIPTVMLFILGLSQCDLSGQS